MWTRDWTKNCFRKPARSGPFFQWGLSVSPKEDQLLFSEQEHGQLELMLAENFR
jgi:hypothetical protein